MRRRKLAELTPYARNPRRIDTRAIAAVAASLTRFGWQQPLVVDPHDVIVVGHTRRLAALELGLTTAPVVTISAEHAAGRAPSRSVPRSCGSSPTSIRHHTGDVYDPFVGAGTTILAGEQESRSVSALEIEPGYVDVAVERWQQLTGKKARRRAA